MAGTEEESGNVVSDVISIRWLLWPFVVHRRCIFICFIAGIILGVAHYFLIPKEYESGMTILPQANDVGSLLSGGGDLAALTGFQLPGITDPTLVYPIVLESSTLVDVVLDAFSDETEQRTLAAVLGYDSTPTDRAEARDAVRDRLKIRRDRRSGVIEVRVRADSPSLAVLLAQAFHDALDRYYRETRATRAEFQSSFLARRLVDVSNRLMRAEVALTAFRGQNRDIHSSPDLMLQQERLEREVLLQQTIYIELYKQLELAKISEHRDSPIIESIDVAETPVRTVFPRFTQSVLMFAMLGFFGALAFAYFNTYTLPYLRRELEND